MRRSWGGLAVFLSIGLVACDGTPATAVDLASPAPPDALRGGAAFALECAGCHAGSDGFDLAFFRFSDATIVRRAVAHVDSSTARDIVAHVRTMSMSGLPAETRLFQPGGAMVASDVAFAVALLGADRWPTQMTTEMLRAVDPRRVRVAVPMPVWSDEGSNLDWLPSRELPPSILDDRGQLARGALAGYRAAPTSANLVRAVSALRVADRRPLNPTAPCFFEEPERADPFACFEVRRWASALVALHLLRHGIPDSVEPALHDVWWDVGNAARHSLRLGEPVQNAVVNWASWMYLGWSFDPSRHASVYTGNGLRRLGLSRHATFVAARSMVARPQGDARPYADMRNGVVFAPAHWAAEVADFSLRHLLERIAAGDVPATAEGRALAREQIADAMRTIERMVAGDRREPLLEAARRVLAALPD